ncbi:hypothetical protein CC78DRAFT_548775 [Lojkania enalia]|uniref:Uncharacterized protein n=1 Tax=Lojkania enalia TaxID=147567 RepID=A0A9P4N1L7_9PLEO|nr:hypothetical protein CC78DRAFT_548775 [Didymosphaeria enalia]
MTDGTRRRIANWMSEIVSASSVNELSDAAPRMAVATVATSTQFTAPSTVQGQLDIRLELVERRSKKVVQLISGKKYCEAVPHLERTITYVESDPNSSFNVNGIDLQLLVAKAYFKASIQPESCENILANICNDTTATLIQRADTATFLYCQLLQTKRIDKTQIKTMGENAVE